MPVIDEPHVIPSKLSNILFGELEEGGSGLGIDRVEFFADQDVARWPLIF